MKDENQRQIEYRRRRQKVLLIKTLLVIGFAGVIFALVLAVSAMGSGYSLDPSKALLVHYSGYQGNGKAELEIIKADIIEDLDEACAKYETAIWPVFKKYTKQDFEALADTITGEISKTEPLSNGEELTIVLDYDRDMAKLLNVDLLYEEIPLVVEGLSDATIVTREQIFEGISLSVNGISPVVSVELVNEPSNEFVETMDFEIENPKEFYKNGDTVTVVASYDEQLAEDAHYVVDADNLRMDYEVSVDKEYITDISQITPEKFKEAFELGKECFTNANEYGLRIFTEAHLRYTWVGTNDYTFEWSNPRLISSYLEVLKDDRIGSYSKKYNYLEIVYEIHISQANGTGCDAEAVVCFDELTIDKNGNVDINPDSGQLFSASYIDRNIKNSLQGWFGDDYEIEKIDLSTMELDQ